MKKLLMIAALATLGATAMAVPPTLQPPVTTGGAKSSSTEVRITANVVQGVAVNEASPIDFGNLVKGMYKKGDIVTQNVPGKVIVKGTPSDTINLKLDTNTATLVWTGFNGSPDDSAGTKDTITDVTVYGLQTGSGESFSLGSSGEYMRSLTASFVAGNDAGDNLGSQQKLGSYVGSVVVVATKTN